MSGASEPEERLRPTIPALGYNWLTGFYDPLLRLTAREGTFKRLLLELFREAGFEEVALRGRLATVYGTLALYGGVKPTDPTRT